MAQYKGAISGEAEGLRALLPRLVAILPGAEITIANDGSNDDTLAVCAEFPVRVISHPYPKGNGAAIKSGARAAKGKVLIFLDADGQHKAEDIPANVLEEAKQGFVAEAQAAGKAGAEVDAEVERKLKKFYEETCLLLQPYVLDEKITIGSMITQGITDLKENIVVRRFVRYELGA